MGSIILTRQTGNSTKTFVEFWLLRGDGVECIHIVPEKYHRAMSDADGRF